MEEKKFLKGTTIVGIKGKDFVAIFGDTQSSFGFRVDNPDIQKVYLLNDYVCYGAAGTVGDIDFIKKVLSIENKYYNLQTGEVFDIDLARNFLFELLYERYYQVPFAPHLVSFVIGGYSESSDNFKLFSCDPLGGELFCDVKYTSTGSGSDFALSILDTEYNQNISLKEALELGIKAIKAAKNRDVFSGGHRIDVAIVSRGFSKVVKGEENIKKLLEK